MTHIPYHRRIAVMLRTGPPEPAPAAVASRAALGAWHLRARRAVGTWATGQAAVLRTWWEPWAAWLHDRPTFCWPW